MLWGEGGSDGGGWAEAGRHLDLEEGGSGLKAHVGHRHPLAAGQVGIARADTGEGGEGQDPRRQRWVWGMGPVHLIRVAERPSSGQGIHDLEGKEGGSEGAEPSARGSVTGHSRPPSGAYLGHLAGFRRLGALEGRRLLAGELQVALARGLEAAVAHAAVVQAPQLPVLPLRLPVAADPEPLGRAPAGARTQPWP